MRHAFDVRSHATLRTFTGEGSEGKPIDLSRRTGSSNLPPLSSISIEAVPGEDASEDSISLSQLFPEARFFGCDDLTLSRWTGDVSACCPGDIVTYRIGEQEPNEFIAEALARGAAGILTEQLLPCPLPQCIVGNLDHALARISAAKHSSPDRKLLTVGVLGHHGKTSTCLLSATLTGALGIRTAYQCDLGSSDGVVSHTSSQPIPVGADLVDWLGEASDCMSRVALIEIDDRAARDGHYDAMQFDVLIVTGKRELADDFGPCGLQCLLDRLTSTGIVIAPDDDARTTRLLDSSSCHQLRYGTTADSEFSAIMVDQSGGMSTLMLCAGDTSAMMETPLCGHGMASNIAAVTALGVLLGHSPHEIGEHLSKLRSIPGRGQRLVDFGHATVVIESGGSVDRISEALRTAKATGCGGRVWCVLSIGDQDCEETLARYGQVAERFAHHAVLTSRPHQSGSFLKQSHQVLDGVKECAAVRLVADRSKAIEWAIGTSRARDTIVVVTNGVNQTAQDARTEFLQIEDLVQKTRSKHSQASGDADAAPEAGLPIKLKLFR